jgi:hypothetical protein
MKGENSTNLNELVLKTIKIYNRYRSPEATAKLVQIKKDNFTVEFSGSFCQSCGVNDYFEDFIHELEDLSKSHRVEIKETKQVDLQSYRVKYVTKGISSEPKDKAHLFREFLQESGLSFREYLTSNACTKDVIKFHFRAWLFKKKPKP